MLYNKCQKEEFIKMSNIKDNQCYLFNKIAPYENELDKDISHFTKEEVFDMFKEIKITSNAILNNYISILGAYIDFNNQVTGANVNVFNSINSKERKQLIDTETLRSKFLTKEELVEICSFNRKSDNNSEAIAAEHGKIENPQVAAAIGLIWSGVSYKNKCEELLNLTVGQFKPAEDLFVINNVEGEEVTLSLERWLSKLLIDIILNEKYYIVRSKKDGTLSRREVPLSNGYKYFFRQIRTKDVYSSDVPISYVALHYRFKTEMKHLNRTSITFKSIADSRVLHEYHQLTEKTTDKLKELIAMYGHTEPTGLAIQYYKQSYTCIYESN